MANKRIINKKIKEAQQILKGMGLPTSQQNEISALTLLALCWVKPTDSWSDSQNLSLTVSKGLMDFIAQEYKKEYAPNTRETFRRQVLHQFVQAYLTNYNPDDPTLPTNSPRAHYGLTNNALETIRTFGSKKWEKALNKFITQNGKLAERYRKERTKNLVPVTFSDGTKFELSPGKHNEVQAAVVQEFAPRFAENSKVLYLGDTAKKNLHVDEAILTKLGIPMTDHDKLPDIVLFDEKKNWIFLIEAVTSHGPVSPKRIVELEKMLKKCTAGKIYVTAFPDLSEFKKHAPEIAWETEVWLMDVPDHMIHFNGDKFMGPR